MIALVKFAVLALFGVAGYLLGLRYDVGIPGVALGLILGGITVYADHVLKKIDFGSIGGGIVGIGAGLALASLILLPLRGIVKDDLEAVAFAVKGVLGYGGMLIGLRRGRGITFPSVFRMIRGKQAEEHLKVLDTSVIIDGRIAEVCESGFLEGVFLVPQFILQELQFIADSQDQLKRGRGRRGLDILHRIQKMPHISVRIVEEDFPKIKEVDAKLVALARMMNAKVVTNDFNLNKVAQLQGVEVLNINELANALRPVALPGEAMKVFVLKEGKEYNQGVAYLDDGTMVVVENGRRLIGRNAEVTVTSVLQTTAGRMIFTRVKEDFDREDVKAAR